MARSNPMPDMTEEWTGAVTLPRHEAFLPIETPRHVHARLLHEQWRARENTFVIGRDIPSRPLAPVLKNVAVLEPNRDHSDFHVRLAGIAWMRRYGCDVTGAMLSQLYDTETFAGRRDLLQALLKDGIPLFREVKLMDSGNIYLHYEMVALRAIRTDRGGPCVLTAIFPYDWAR